jgi:hypothetical protein
VNHLQVEEEQERAEILDRQGDADVQSRDRGEVERLHPGQPDDPEDRQPAEVSLADLEQARAGDREHRRQRRKRAYRSQLREA